MNTWPKQSECVSFYGDPRGRNGQVDNDWKLKNLSTVKPPFKMEYTGLAVSSVTVHRKCNSSLAKVFAALWAAAGQDQAKIDAWGVSIFGGSFNFRLMRNSNHLSMHSFGCAIDLAPNLFPMGQHTSKFAPEVVKAFADEGWVNLPNDPMHFQAAIVG